MEVSIVVREYRPGDEAACRQILTEGTMATVNTCFLSGLTRELTFQLIVLTAALMFIFLGVPLGWCVLAAPVVVAAMYSCVWLWHAFKALELCQDVGDIPRLYMSSELTGFWVAEAREPVLGRWRVVGTVAVAQSRQSEGSAWVRRLAVSRDYRRRGVASALLQEAVHFCQQRGYTSVEAVTSEFHHGARQLLHNYGFELKQVYHRPVVGALLAVCMYQLSHKISASTLATEP